MHSRGVDAPLPTLRFRVPDAAQRFFSGAPQSRDPSVPSRIMGPAQQRITPDDAEPVIGPLL